MTDPDRQLIALRKRSKMGALEYAVLRFSEAEAECKRLREENRTLAQGIDAMQVGHEAPWDTAEEEPGTWRVECANGNYVEESYGPDAEKHTRATCKAVNKAADLARALLSKGASDGE